MKLSEFDYDLPKERIALYPAEKRDEARLMVLDRKNQTIAHRVFKGIIDYFQAGDLLVLNDTKVLPCRLCGVRRSGGKVEILLLERKAQMSFGALVKPGRLRVDEEIYFKDAFIVARLSAKNEVTFKAPSVESIYALGMMPLPPYIKREPCEADREDYQTVYASNPGSVASPTAGLHFTQELLMRLKAQGVITAFVTLHVGHATFKPVTVEEIASHVMGKEYFQISHDTQQLIEKARAQKSRIIAVGTTTCRVLETYATGLTQGYSDLFIYPGYRFKIIDGLLTNFHLPRTTLLMLASAFAGKPLLDKAYQTAIQQKYRFFSYGDAMLIV